MKGLIIKMLRAVIFDLDNTLIDFMRMKRMSLDAAVTAMIDAGLEIDKERALSLMFKIYDKYGYEDPKIFQRFLRRTLNKIDYSILAHGIVAYRRVRGGFLESYPHAMDVLYSLRGRGLKLAILSDAPRIKAWIRLASMKLTRVFDVVVTFDDTKKLKPASAPFKVVLRKLRVAPGECLMVGDRPERDIEGAKKMGMRTCFAQYGSPKDRARADYVISDLRQVLDVVEKEIDR